MRSEPISDDQGGWIESMIVAATVPCRIAPASSSEVEIAKQRNALVTHALYLPAGTDLRIGDVVVLESGREMRVSIPDLSPSIPTHHRKALVVEQQSVE
jgi:hypothetical protein